VYAADLSASVRLKSMRAHAQIKGKPFARHVAPGSGDKKVCCPVLIADGFGVHVPKGYIYAAMAFSTLVEVLNMLSRRGKSRAG
jgi:hypothetical protein